MFLSYRCFGNPNFLQVRPAKKPKLPNRSQNRNVLVCIRNVSDQHSDHPDDWRGLMQDSILRLESGTVDVVIKTHPFAEILYWGPHLHHFSPQDTLSLS